MTTFYLIFAIMAVYAECSSSINTRNLLKKLALFLIVISCIVELGGSSNHLLEYGSMLYIAADFWRKFWDHCEQSK